MVGLRNEETFGGNMNKLIEKIEELHTQYVRYRSYYEDDVATYNFYDGKTKAAEEILAMIKHKLF